ncbi:MAG: nucleotidyltransferase domain-containing protein [Bryobacteraceae bacterium]
MAAESPTTPSIDDRALAEMVRRLVEVYHPDRVYLFGSVARGEAGPDSDYDIMVVVPDHAPAQQAVSRVGYRAVRDLGLPRDIFVWKSSDFARQLHLKASLPSTIVREGRLLYGN